MSPDAPNVGPLQLLMVGFDTTERFHGQIARELADLRGRGLLRVLDARLLHRTPDGELAEIDLGPLLAAPEANPVASLLGLNGAGGNGGMTPPEAFHHTAGFAVEDLRRLTDEIQVGDYAVAILVEHLWAARLRSTVRETGGRLLGQGFLTPEVVMLVGAEIQARAEAEAAIELAEAARGAALVEALGVLAKRERDAPENRVAAASQVIGVLVGEGFIHDGEAAAAIEALATAGLLETATVQAAVTEAEDLLAKLEGDEG
jgi:hypothetical protein